MNENIDNILPEDFDGVFRFTNDSDEEFVGVWGGKEYHFPAKTTSPMIIPDHSPLQIQYIRQKFAKDWAEREFFKSSTYENLRRIEGERDAFTGMIKPTLSSSLSANSYNLKDLEAIAQRCLQPLTITQAKVTDVTKVDMEDLLSRDPKNGNLNTAPASDETDLEKLAKGKASLKDKAGI